MCSRSVTELNGLLCVSGNEPVAKTADKVRNPLSALTQCCTFENIAHNGDYLAAYAHARAQGTRSFVSMQCASEEN